MRAIVICLLATGCATSYRPPVQPPKPACGVAVSCSSIDVDTIECIDSNGKRERHPSCARRGSCP